ncbi:zinc finger protein interacting with ribonucleoprotein K-like isoform X2 [Hetaerina americana]|uniref:zinc finger protein interacting with ribonucleoprotein K-like isoform X2 n=1 Tax=Hetaerina americana TaxID=62018 RepID=UPI003A7F451A
MSDVTSKLNEETPECRIDNGERYEHLEEVHSSDHEESIDIEEASVNIEESSYDKSCNHQHLKGMDICILSDFVPEEVHHGDMMSDVISKLKTEVQDLEETPECRINNGDRFEHLEKVHSSDHEESIDIEEMDMSRIKREPSDFDHANRSEELCLGNESRATNQKQRESSVVASSSMLKNEMRYKDCSNALVRNGEDLSSTDVEERSHNSSGRGQHVSEDLHHPKESAVGYPESSILGDSESATTIRSLRSHEKDRNSTNNVVQCSEPYPVVDSSLKDCYKMQKNQVVVVKKEESVISSEIHSSKDVEMLLKGNRTLGNSPLHIMVTKDLKSWNHARLRPRKDVKKSCMSPPSSDEGSDEVFSCHICGNIFYHKSSLKSHLMSHNSVSLFECEACGNKFNSKHLLSKHACNLQLELRGVGPSVQLHARTSSDSSSSPKICNSKKPFECGVCGRGFHKCENLEEHIHTHTGSREYESTSFDRECNSKSSVLTHRATVRRESPVMCKCGVCGKKFARSYFKRHQRSHLNVQRYTCNECGNSFIQKCHLKVHMRVHTGDRPFKCTFCSKDFAQSGNLREHLRVHTGDRPYKCPVCSKDFAHSSNLKGHQRVHTGIKPYSCPKCGQCFSHNQSFKRHLLSHTECGISVQGVLSKVCH